MHDGPPAVLLVRPGSQPATVSKQSRLRTFLALLVALSTAFVLIQSPVPAAATAQMRLAPGKSTTVKFGPNFTNGTAGASYVVPKGIRTGVYLGVALRSSTAKTGYRARVRIAPDGSLRVGISRGEQVLLSKNVPGKARAGQTVRVEGSVSGSKPVKVAVRAWVEGKSAPGWQQKITDNAKSRIRRSGHARTWAFLPSSAGKSMKVGVKEATTRGTSTSRPAPAKPAPKPRAAATGGKPSAANTGVPSGTKLKQHRGNITITKDGTRLDRLDIHGFVSVKADNVKITNSIIRGGKPTAGNNQGLLSNFGFKNLVIEDSEFKAEYKSKWFIGLRGWNFTARRIHVTGNVDNMMIHGDNVRVERSLLEKTDWYASHPMQNGGPTHSDNIQILQGKNISIVANTIRGAQNYPILGSASNASVPNLSIDGNYLDGGWCTLKLQTRNGHGLSATVKNNKFGPNRHEKHCVFLAPPEIKLSAGGNVFEANGAAVPILRVKA